MGLLAVVYRVLSIFSGRSDEVKAYWKMKRCYLDLVFFELIIITASNINRGVDGTSNQVLELMVFNLPLRLNSK